MRSALKWGLTPRSQRLAVHRWPLPSGELYCCFLRIFFGVVEWCFYRGFCENVAADGGFLMVNLWWDAGERW